jgi:hypothetical protein
MYSIVADVDGELTRTGMAVVCRLPHCGRRLRRRQDGHSRMSVARPDCEAIMRRTFRISGSSIGEARTLSTILRVRARVSRDAAAGD